MVQLDVMHFNHKRPKNVLLVEFELLNKTYIITVPFIPPPLLCITRDTSAWRSSNESTPINFEVIASDCSDDLETWQPPRASSGFSSKVTLPKCNTAATSAYNSSLVESFRPKRVRAWSSCWKSSKSSKIGSFNGPLAWWLFDLLVAGIFRSFVAVAKYCVHPDKYYLNRETLSWFQQFYSRAIADYVQLTL